MGVGGEGEKGEKEVNEQKPTTKNTPTKTAPGAQMANNTDNDNTTAIVLGLVLVLI